MLRRWSHWPSNPVHYIADFWILGQPSKKDTRAGCPYKQDPLRNSACNWTISKVLKASPTIGKREKLKSFRDNWTENSLCPINPWTLIYWIKLWIRSWDPLPTYIFFQQGTITKWVKRAFFSWLKLICKYQRGFREEYQTKFCGQYFIENLSQ